MTLIVTVFVNGGIAMAADSRMIITKPQDINGKSVHLPVGFSDTAQKLFVTKAGVGISVCGQGVVGTNPISAHIEAFRAAGGDGLPVDEGECQGFGVRGGGSLRKGEPNAEEGRERKRITDDS